jgi:hypothetical protein
MNTISKIGQIHTEMCSVDEKKFNNNNVVVFQNKLNHLDEIVYNMNLGEHYVFEVRQIKSQLSNAWRALTIGRRKIEKNLSLS